MRLHLLGIPHTRSTLAFSHCAFTQKVVKFIPMMKAQGFDIVHYGVGEECPPGAENVLVLDVKRQEELLGFDPLGDKKAFVGNAADIGNPLYQEFNARLEPLLRAAVAPEDIVCFPFGYGHAGGGRSHAGIVVESGIGYPDALPETFKIYESNAWAAWHAGRHQRPGSQYEWVIPNYFDTSEWAVGAGPRNYLAYLGRLTEIKGLPTILAIAEKRPDLQIFLAGQGDPGPWLGRHPNVGYVGPLTGRERSSFLGGALALLAPSAYVEPFCGVTVEANLCGTPAFTTNFGAFQETIVPGVNGYRCHTLGDFLGAIRRAEAGHFNPQAIRALAESRYSFPVVGRQYRAAFEQLSDLRSNGALGWYSPQGRHVPFP
mgnify:CR=1 FL=1